LKNRNQVVTWS